MTKQSELIRKIRNQENEIANLSGSLSIEKTKRKQAEEDVKELSRQNAFVAQLRKPRPQAFTVPKARCHNQATAILVATDWHVEEKVDPSTINGLNEYNLEIASMRIKTFFERALELLDSARSLSKIEDLVFAILGDMITGYIHEELQESNYLSPVEACLFAEDQLCSGIDFLLKRARVKSLTIPTCYGNHGRTTAKPRFSTGYANSYEWLLYNHIARYYPKVHWQIGKGYTNYLNVQNKVVRFHHGDGFRYKEGVGGITIPVIKAIAKWDLGIRADLDIFGHWHQYLVNTKFISCGCLIGYNAYCERIKAEPTDPSQTFIVLDAKRKRPVTVQEVFCT